MLFLFADTIDLPLSFIRSLLSWLGSVKRMDASLYLPTPHEGDGFLPICLQKQYGAF